jgi:hypothetical protein
MTSAALVPPLPATTRHAAACLYHQQRMAAHRIMFDVAQVEGLPPLYRAHAEAIAKLCSMHLARIIGQAEPADFHSLKGSVEDVAKATDKLLLAIGEEAAAGSRDIDLTLFDDQFWRAVEGNATSDLEHAAERMEEERAEFGADRSGHARASLMGVD